MLKGHTRIELRNVETGEVEVHEDDNLVTNALNKIININVSQNMAPDSQLLPLAEKALGGIMLFDNTLTESPENIHWPTEAHIVACACHGDTNTECSMNGSYNALESGKTDNGYVSVWDFGTSQANGTIKSVARTSTTGGLATFYNTQIGYTYHYSGCPATDSRWWPIRFDGEYLYLLKGDTNTHIMRLARTKAPILKFGIADYSYVFNNYEIIASWSTLLTTFEYYTNYDHTQTAAYDVYADDPMLYEDGHDGYLYCMASTRTGNRSHGWISDYPYDLTYFTIKYGDDSYEKSEIVRLNLGLADYAHEYNHMRWARRDYGHVINGVYYRLSSSRKIIHKIPLANPSSYSAFTIFSSDVSDYVYEFAYMNSLNGGVFITVYHYHTSGTSWRSGFVYPDGVVIIRDIDDGSNINYHGNNKMYTNGPVLSDDLVIFTYDDYGGTDDSMRVLKSYFSRYLGTINNLASPITKTAAQTMKIIYTFTDVDE